MPFRVFPVLKARRRGFAAISALAASSWARWPRLRDRFCRRSLVVLLPAALVLVAPAAFASTAQATTLKVTTTADKLTSGDGVCSLREAVAAVNSPGTATDCGTASSTSNTIVLPAGTFTLSIAPTGTDDNSSGDLNVTGTAPLTISGAGKSKTKIDATGLGDRVLSTATGATVTLRNLEISGGHAPDGASGSGGNGADGGGINNAGTLSLIGVNVAGNAAGAGGAGANITCQPLGPCSGSDGGNGASGGGIYNAGTLTVTGSAILNNNAGGGGPGGSYSCHVSFGLHRCDYDRPGSGGGGGAGGGIDNVGSAAKLTVTNSTINGNQGGDGGPGAFVHDLDGYGGGGGGGGGIANQDGTLVVSRSTLASNTAGSGGEAGDAVNFGGYGGNGAGGGGISAMGGSLQVTNSTLAGNDAGSGGEGGAGGCCGTPPGSSGSGGNGGAIATSGLADASRLYDATIANNAAGWGEPHGSGGGVAAGTAGQVLTLQNTIVASNNANGAANCYPASGVANGGHDLSYGDTSCPGGNGNPALLPLADYGGPTETMALGPGSTALDQVPSTGAGCPATDQRGVKRPQGPACDIGAFEFAAPTVTITTPANGAHYQRGQDVLAAYTCSEGGITSPIASGGCVGTVPNGQPIDTSSPGTYSFTVTATDKAGDAATTTTHYTVS